MPDKNAMYHHSCFARTLTLGILAAAVSAPAAEPLRLVREAPLPRVESSLARFKPVATHTHNLRSGELPFQTSKSLLVEWCRKMGIAALGVGSPWEPESFALYKRYEGLDRDLYDSGKMDPESVTSRAQIAALFAELNRKSEGATLFYQDNETPKNRLGHAWWFGYHYDVPAWHDYSQDRPIQYWEEDDEIEINSITGKPHRRRCLLEIMAAQRAAGALGIFAHPTSWWLNGSRFVTNIASEVSMFLMSDGYLDGMVVMGYNADHHAYQKLWFHLLDTGAVVPGFAENDTFLDSKRTFASAKAYLNYLEMPGPINVPGIVAAARRGASFMSTGAYLAISVDGVPMGRVAPTRKGGMHRLRIEAFPHPGQTRFGRIEVIGKGGEVLVMKDGFGGGVLEYDLPGRDEPHYVVVKAFGQDDLADRGSPRTVEHLAISNPVYLHPKGFRFRPVRTEYTLRIQPGTPWLGGTLEFQTATGETISRQRVRPGTVRMQLPANARVQLTKPGMESRRFYIAMENPRVQKLLAYLYRGEFRRDYPGLSRGDVPPAAFQIDAMRDALRRTVYVLE